VNEKVEGYFAVCKAKGLTGKQGVMIPQTNERHLMLSDEVVAAVKKGKFHLWSVATIDQGIEILTGMAAGERQKDGSYPKGTINYLVDQRLREMLRQLKSHDERDEKGAEKKAPRTAREKAKK
jgi:predicted ATP-dependent protease